MVLLYWVPDDRPLLVLDVANKKGAVVCWDSG